MTGKLFILFLAVAGVYAWFNLTPKSVLDFAAAQRVEPWSPRTEFWLGVWHHGRKEFPEAETAFQQVLTDHASSYYAPLATVKLGRVYEDSGRKGDAFETFKGYLEKYPEGADRDLVQRKVEQLRY